MRKHLFKILFNMTLLCLLTMTNLRAQEGLVTVNQDKQIEVLLKLKKELNRTESNYKIQIYNGNRSGAQEIRLEFNRLFNDWIINRVFETPNYKIWVGDFQNQLEADRALLEVKKKFRNAFIFKPNNNKKTLK